MSSYLASEKRICSYEYAHNTVYSDSKRINMQRLKKGLDLVNHT